MHEIYQKLNNSRHNFAPITFCSRATHDYGGENTLRRLIKTRFNIVALTRGIFRGKFLAFYSTVYNFTSFLVFLQHRLVGDCLLLHILIVCHYLKQYLTTKIVFPFGLMSIVNSDNWVTVSDVTSSVRWEWYVVYD